MFAILRNYGMLMLYEFYTTIQKAQSLLMGNCQRNSRLQPVSSKEDISISHFPLHHCFRVCNEKRNQKQSRRRFDDSSKKIQRAQSQLSCTVDSAVSVDVMINTDKTEYLSINYTANQNLAVSSKALEKDFRYLGSMVGSSSASPSYYFNFPFDEDCYSSSVKVSWSLLRMKNNEPMRGK